LGEDHYTGKIFLPLGPPPILGDSIIITVRRTGFGLSDHQICSWLRLFGNIVGQLKYKYHPELPTVKDDHLEVLMKLNKHIPSTLPAFGKKIIVYYRAQPIQCSKCYELGHVRKNCTASVVNWLGYVKNLRSLNYIPDKLFGVWLGYLRASEANSQQPTDPPSSPVI